MNMPVNMPAHGKQYVSATFYKLTAYTLYNKLTESLTPIFEYFFKNELHCLSFYYGGQDRVFGIV